MPLEASHVRAAGPLLPECTSRPMHREKRASAKLSLSKGGAKHPMSAGVSRGTVSVRSFDPAVRTSRLDENVDDDARDDSTGANRDEKDQRILVET